jgi:hypothetical protein
MERNRKSVHSTSFGSQVRCCSRARNPHVFGEVVEWGEAYDLAEVHSEAGARHAGLGDDEGDRFGLGLPHGLRGYAPPLGLVQHLAASCTRTANSSPWSVPAEWRCVRRSSSQGREKSRLQFLSSYQKEGLVDRSRRPHSCSHTTVEPIENAILVLQAKHPSWGARKLKARLEMLQPDVVWPAASTFRNMEIGEFNVEELRFRAARRVV